MRTIDELLADAPALRELAPEHRRRLAGCAVNEVKRPGERIMREGEAARTRVWDSCFSVDYSYIHGGAVRQTPRARYRQWLTHKLGTWHDQFGSSGCVGCGRCITWCPVAIDITEEVAAIRAAPEEES